MSPSGADDIAVGEALLDAQPPDIVRRLKQDGLIVLVTVEDPNAPPTDPSSAVVGFALFDPPPAQVYRLLSQTARQIEFRTELKSIETVAWDDDGPIDRHRIRILFQGYEYHLDYALNPTMRTITWHLADSYENDLSRVDGSWELYAMNSGTLGRFTTSVDVSGGIPRFVQDFFTARSLPATLGNCRRWVNSGGTYRP